MLTGSGRNRRDHRPFAGVRGTQGRCKQCSGCVGLSSASLHLTLELSCVEHPLALEGSSALSAAFLGTPADVSFVWDCLETTCWNGERTPAQHLKEPHYQTLVCYKLITFYFCLDHRNQRFCRRPLFSKCYLKYPILYWFKLVYMLPCVSLSSKCKIWNAFHFFS